MTDASLASGLASLDIDTSLVPGMMNLNLVEALDRANGLLNEMKESAGLCNRLLERLLFLREELQTPSESYSHLRQLSAEERKKVTMQLANAVGLVINVFKMYTQKTALKRIASSRAIREEIPVLHSKIDKVFALAGLTNAPEMIAWKAQEASDIATQRRLLEALVRNRSAISSDLSSSVLEEALMELKYEIDSGKISKEFTVVLEDALQTAVSMVEGAQVPAVPEYYVRRDDVEIGEQIDVGSFGEVHKAKWGPGKTEVVVKQLFMDGADTKNEFRKEATIWSRLNHPNVNKMLAGCPVGKPLFFVAEFAKKGNFADFFRTNENRSKMWRLFHEVAQGLSYLHGERIIHCDLKCNNILIGNDGKAKLCDFGFSHIRTLSIGMSVKPQPIPARWKAPECLLLQGLEANPTFKSDIYSFGMTIIEAKIDGVPWGMIGDEEIVEEISEGNGHPRPDDVFTDQEWKLVEAMTAFDPGERMSLAEVTAELAELAKEEEAANTTPQPSIPCGKCSSANQRDNKYCGKCGKQLGGEASESLQP